MSAPPVTPATPEPTGAPDETLPGQILPVAGRATLRAYLVVLARRHRRLLVTMLALHAAAALAGLVAPRLLGAIVEEVQSGGGVGTVDRLTLVIAAALVAQTVLTRAARYRSFVFGEEVLAELREDFVANTLALPIGTVESAGSGDLLTRTSRDVEQLGWSVRWALPEWLISLITAVLTVVAALFVGLWVAGPLLIGVPGVVIGARWYLRRAGAGYLRENASYSRMNASLTETVEGARTVEALGLADARIARIDDDIAESYAAERYTLMLRTRFFPSVEVTSYLLPSVATLLLGGWLYGRGEVSLGEVTAATLYVQMLIDPVDRLVAILDELQVGAASLARLLGVGEVPDDRVTTDRTPQGDALVARDVRFSYVEGRDVLHGVDLTLAVGERLAMVGPSGRGQVHPGPPAGRHPPAAHRHGRGRRCRAHRAAVGAAAWSGRAGDPGAPRLRRHGAGEPGAGRRPRPRRARPGDPADPRRSDPDAELFAALEAVDADVWVRALPQGLDTVVGSGGLALGPAQAQQLALARLVLADPHTLVLDEATSLIDPRAARHLERSLAAVLEGRTVVAIAHRLFSAHDADRVAVVEDGVVSELGSHDELVARGGSYARLWESWQA